ncbi:TPA: hypothetical protein N0F65_006043 [Lagenidium giganteum]|uniref:Uncharacterized protein n=1 Tax=Lagenidium giganteum TaxID=4803 RepID=A0AAV2ZBA3_9STRA|nr:TPA: hypothetical protein N0F65_006043 [Lagenidium giganteum]
MQDCPTASEAEKEEARQRNKRAKTARVHSAPARHQVVINELIEVPFCPDTDRPTASEAEKEEARQRNKRAKTARVHSAPARHQVVINELIETLVLIATATSY